MSQTLQAIQLMLPNATLPGDLGVPPQAVGLVVFAHGSGSNRFSPRNRFVAERLHENGLAALLFNLLTADEDQHPHNHADVDLLTRRLVGAAAWAQRQPDLLHLPLGLFGASLGAAAALNAAAQLGEAVRAVVARGGRPDLARPALAQVHAPTLLLVGGNDDPIIGYNEEARQLLGGRSELRIISGAGHLFAEPGALEHVAEDAAQWFSNHLVASTFPNHSP